MNLNIKNGLLISGILLGLTPLMVSAADTDAASTGTVVIEEEQVIVTDTPATTDAMTPATPATKPTAKPAKKTKKQKTTTNKNTTSTTTTPSSSSPAGTTAGTTADTTAPIVDSNTPIIDTVSD